MPNPTRSSRRLTVTALTWTGLLAIPTLAVAVAGPAVRGDSSATAPPALAVANVPVPAAQAAKPGDNLQGVWQNTLLPVYFPPQFSGYRPPGP